MNSPLPNKRFLKIEILLYCSSLFESLPVFTNLEIWAKLWSFKLFDIEHNHDKLKQAGTELSQAQASKQAGIVFTYSLLLIIFCHNPNSTQKLGVP